jgi:hypothetical protein
MALPKLRSDLRMNRLAQRKQVGEIFGELTAFLKERSAAHPLAVQAKFLAATECSPKWCPDGDEILNFLEDRELATHSNTLEFAICSELVAHSSSERAFTPRGIWTHGRLRGHWWGEFAIYMICGGFGFAVTFSPEVGPVRYVFAIPAVLYAIQKLPRLTQINRARRFLKLTQKKASPHSVTLVGTPVVQEPLGNA